MYTFDPNDYTAGDRFFDDPGPGDAWNGYDGQTGFTFEIAGTSPNKFVEIGPSPNSDAVVITPALSSSDAYLAVKRIGLATGIQMRFCVRYVDRDNYVAFVTAGSGGGGRRLAKNVSGTRTDLITSQGVTDEWLKIEADGEDYALFAGGTGSSPSYSQVGSTQTITNAEVSTSETTVGLDSIATSSGTDLFTYLEADTLGGGGTALVVQDISHTVTIEGITLTQANVLAAQGIAHTQTVDSATLEQESSISADGVTQSQAIDNTTLTQANAVAPNSMNQGQSIDPATLTQAHVLVPDGVAQGQSIDAITLLAAGTLDIRSLAQSQTIDEALLTVAGVLSLDGVTQAQTLEALELVQASVLAPNGITQSQSVDVATLAAASQSVSMDDVSQSQTLDATALTQYHVLSVDSLTQAQVIDVCLFGGLVIGELEGQIVIYAAMGGAVYAIPALSGTIH